MERRYRALRVISTIYKIIGGIVAISTLLLIIGNCLMFVLGGVSSAAIMNDLDIGGSMLAGGFGGFLVGALVALVLIIYGGGIALTFYAAGEGIQLFIDIEENTRQTNLFLRQRAQPERPVSPPAR